MLKRVELFLNLFLKKKGLFDTPLLYKQGLSDSPFRAEYDSSVIQWTILAFRPYGISVSIWNYSAYFHQIDSVSDYVLCFLNHREIHHAYPDAS